MLPRGSEQRTLVACGIAEPWAADGFERELHGVVVRHCGDLAPGQVRSLLDDLGHVLLHVATLDPGRPLDIAAMSDVVAPKPNDRRSAWVDRQTAILDAAMAVVGKRWPESNAAGVAAVLCWRLAEQSDPR